MQGCKEYFCSSVSGGNLWVGDTDVYLTKARYAHQCDFLNQCLHSKVIPKGLNIGLKVNFLGNPSL